MAYRGITSEIFFLCHLQHWGHEFSDNLILPFICDRKASFEQANISPTLVSFVIAIVKDKKE